MGVKNKAPPLKLVYSHRWKNKLRWLDHHVIRPVLVTQDEVGGSAADANSVAPPDDPTKMHARTPLGPKLASDASPASSVDEPVAPHEIELA